ncbi:MAG: NAD(P)-dependent oxidoreductase, partial [bacterium]
MAETILVTGISGFIAGNLAMTLAQSGATVVGVGRNPPQASSPDIRFIPLDIRNFDAVCRVMQEVRPSTVYHLAACSTLAAAQTEGARAVLETNVG